MIEKIHTTRCGDIHYWVSDEIKPGVLTLLFLPGLTADHRLFEKQIPCFESEYNVFVWDAPAHAASRPFSFDFTLKDKALWLNEIIEKESLPAPVIIGQSMGGYVGQMYLELFPKKLCGFVSIDSAPLQRHYMTGAEIWLLKHTEGMYRVYPWKALVRDGAKGCAETEYGRRLMKDMMLVYDSEGYAKLAGHGYRLLAEALEADLPYEIKCPAILICGEKDKAGSAKNYNKRWAAETKLPVYWIAGAGHNSNTDAPSDINRLIDAFLCGLPAASVREEEA